MQPENPNGTQAPAADHEAIIQTMRQWVDKAVIGLNLCPFAKAVQVKGQVRYVVCDAVDENDVLTKLARELLALADADPQEVDTTLLMLPNMFEDFLDFNDFLGLADELLENLGLEGTLQIADFHPRYQFAGTEADDMGNYTNRAPYPTLHLLREDSIDAAVQAFPEADAIFERNIEVLEKLGPQGWKDLGIPTACPHTASANHKQQP